MCEQTEEHGKVTFRNVVVRGFGRSLNDKQLRVYFRDNIGDVESAEVAKFENGVSKGYGYVCFYNSEDAVKAIRKINGKKLHGNTLLVEEFKSEEQRNQEFLRSVDVEGFAESLNEKALSILFARFGEVEYSKVERDINGSSWGLGYVCFSKREDAQHAARMMNGYKLGPVYLIVELRDEKQKKLKNKQLHIRNLHDSVNEVELEKLFEPYGKIRICRVDPSPRVMVKQGYVCFSKEEEADEAIANLHRRLYKGLKLLVAVQQTKQNSRRVSESKVDKVPPKASLPKNDHMARKNAVNSKSTGNLSINSNNVEKSREKKSRIAASFSENRTARTECDGTKKEKRPQKPQKAYSAYTSVPDLLEESRNELLRKYTWEVPPKLDEPSRDIGTKFYQKQDGTRKSGCNSSKTLEEKVKEKTSASYKPDLLKHSSDDFSLNVTWKLNGRNDSAASSTNSSPQNESFQRTATMNVSTDNIDANTNSIQSHCESFQRRATENETRPVSVTWKLKGHNDSAASSTNSRPQGERLQRTTTASVTTGDIDANTNSIQSHCESFQRRAAENETTRPVNVTWKLKGHNDCAASSTNSSPQGERLQRTTTASVTACNIDANTNSIHSHCESFQRRATKNETTRPANAAGVIGRCFESLRQLAIAENSAGKRSNSNDAFKSAERTGIFRPTSSEDTTEDGITCDTVLSNVGYHTKSFQKVSSENPSKIVQHHAESLHRNTSKSFAILEHNHTRPVNAETIMDKCLENLRQFTLVNDSTAKRSSGDAAVESAERSGNFRQTSSGDSAEDATISDNLLSSVEHNTKSFQKMVLGNTSENRSSGKTQENCLRSVQNHVESLHRNTSKSGKKAYICGKKVVKDNKN